MHTNSRPINAQYVIHLKTVIIPVSYQDHSDKHSYIQILNTKYHMHDGLCFDIPATCICWFTTLYSYEAFR